MDVAEMFVSALVSLLVDNLAPGALSFIPDGRIDDKINEWRHNLLMIESVLADAEDRQFTEPSVRHWLHDVQNLVYEIEDFVDDYTAEARCPQVMDEPESSRPSKLRKFFSGLFSSKTISTSISFYPATNLRISEITNSLQELEKTKNKLGLREYVGGKSERTVDLRLPSTSLVAPAIVYGREKDSAAILSWMFQDRTNDHDNNVCIISIVGMGGIGKTTLAQSLYNNEQVEGWFHDRAWVCVTEDFDVLKISKIIYEGVSDESCAFNDLNKVQVKLMEKLSKKKFLLVLDDVWNQDYEKWHLLCAPFHGGAPGSTIIVTTRSRDVAKTMGSKEVYELEVLSNEDCLSLLAQHAFEKQNFDVHPEFKEVGEVIAKRCNGLPLAAMSLGGLLRTKGNLKQWAEVSTSKIWEIQSNGIIPALRLSYHHLPPYLKPLFAYCSIFPKAHEFDKQELIKLWMAQGFLRKSKGQKQMEELGCEYFGELLSRSFFQPLIGKSRFLMHDLNNDLAQAIAGLTSLRLDDEVVSDEQYKVYEKARHVSFISGPYADSKKFMAFNGARCLRTVLPIREKFWGFCFLSSLVLKEFPRLPCLRALSLNGYFISKLPKSIGNMNHLRYLDLSWTNIKELPKSVCAFSNLQTLLLRGCHKLVQLPKSIQKLINLRHLDIVDTPSLKEMPLGIGLLTRLRTLSKFIIDKSNEQNIIELKGLHHLQGTLSIIGIENVMNVQDVMEANLLCKEGLHGLELIWSSSFCCTQEEGLEFKVLDALKPQTGLASLKIEFYGGQKFPSWVGDNSFCNMVKIRLISCQNCIHLPPLGHLTSLKELFIEGMYGVKVVGCEFLGTDSPNIVAFPSLINLNLRDMKDLMEWSAISTNGDESLEGAFPCLQELKMSGCMKLNKVSLPKIPSLQTLGMDACRKTALRSVVRVGLVKKLEVGDILGLSNLDEGILGCLGKVENLGVSGCKQLKYLWQEEVACRVLQNLKWLKIVGCEQLESLGDKEQLLPHNLESLELGNCDKLEKMPNWKNNLASLRKLRISSCEKLKDNFTSTPYLKPTDDQEECSFSDRRRHGDYEFSNLKSVDIDECTSLKWFPTGKKLPTSLRYLNVSYCENMMEAEKGEKGASLSLLTAISFCEWSNIKSLPQGLTYLTRLKISSCQGIESIPETSLPPTLISLDICNCSNLKYMLYANEMRSLTCLQQLSIICCKNLEGYPSGGCWPPKLEYLSMGEVKQPITEWGLATLPTSFRKLELSEEFPQVVTFTEEGTQLPRSLTSLYICSLKNLESLEEGLQNLSSLQHLHIYGCPKLRALPQPLLPTLSSLQILNCPALQERCKKERRDYWPKLSHIPCLILDPGAIDC